MYAIEPSSGILLTYLQAGKAWTNGTIQGISDDLKSALSDPNSVDLTTREKLIADLTAKAQAEEPIDGDDVVAYCQLVLDRTNGEEIDAWTISKTIGAVGKSEEAFHADCLALLAQWESDNDHS